MATLWKSSTQTIGDAPVLDVRGLTVAYETEKGRLDTVRDVSLNIRRGEIYGLVGESGSGKTTLARAIVRYLPRNGRISGGAALLDGVDLQTLSPAELRRVWGNRITMVHQDPAGAVNPAIPVGEQIAEVARVHLGMNRTQAWQKALEMLNKVQLPDPESTARRYAHQLSGGMLQRILIAAALTTNPQLLIMDEPTTALDVTTEAVILDLVRDLLREYDAAVLYITHNLGVVARLCQRVGVMYAGEIMEEGSVAEVFDHKLHPYTLGLLGCVPRVDMSKRDIDLHTIPGYIPRPDALPQGCIFAPRCRLAEDACRAARPPLFEARPGHRSACRRWQEVEDNLERIVATHEPVHNMENSQAPLTLDVHNIEKRFKLTRRGLSNPFAWRPVVVRAVDNISIRVRKGFTMGIVGESGCGKTTLARCIAGLETADSGDIFVDGEALPYSIARRSKAMLKKIQMVFQNPNASLNPQLTVGQSVGRPLALPGGATPEQIEQRVRELFQAVNLPEDYIYRLPHELSGGEKQRVAIARAFAADPTLMILDEPISSLDVSVQASLMNLLAGVILAIMFFYSVGDPIENKVLIDFVAEGSPAEAAGMLPGDLVLEVNGQPIDGVSALQAVIEANAGKSVAVLLQRGEETLTVNLTPRVDPPEGQGPLGVGLSNPRQPIGLNTAVTRGATEAYRNVQGILLLPVRMMRGEASAEEGRLVGYKGMYDIFVAIQDRLWFFMAISISLGVMNLLPIPALDGGRILLTLPEILIRKRVPAQYENMIHLVGFAVLILLLIYINIQDFVNPLQLP